MSEEAPAAPQININDLLFLSMHALRAPLTPDERNVAIKLRQNIEGIAKPQDNPPNG